MEYAEFKNMCEAITLGDKQVPEDNVFIAIINTAMIDIANKTAPFSLISKDVTDEPLRYIDDIYFVKKPTKIVQNSDLIILDDDLIGALAHRCCESFVSKDMRNYHNQKMWEIINNFNWSKTWKR